MAELIKSFSYEQEQIIQDIISLYVDGKTFDADVTYGKGNFYKNIPRPKQCFDIAPQLDYVIKADCRSLPLNDESIKSVMYDPPFLATTGASLRKNDDSNIIAKRFGVYENEYRLHKFYCESLRELYRVLSPGGIAIVKCQDKVSSGTQYISHNFIINKAEQMGFYTKDIFILIAKNRIVANWQRNQKHARKFHSYFIVFEKNDNKNPFLKMGI